MAVRHWQNHQPGLILLLTDPDWALESAKSVSTWTGSHARDGVINLRENPYTISSLVYCLA